MKKSSYYLGLVIWFAAPGGGVAGPLARPADEPAIRLQQAIDRASEQGNFSHVQTLRL